MPNLAVTNRAQLSYKLEGIYPSNFGIPQGGNGVLLNMLSETLDWTIKNESSKQIRSDRQVPDIVQVSGTAQGGFGFEAQYAEYDPFIEAVLQGTWAPYGTNGISTANANTLTCAIGTLTASAASAGADVFTGIAKGQWFSIVPAAGESASTKAYFAKRAFRASRSVATTTTVITLEGATPIDTTVITAPLVAGWQIASSVVTNGNVMKSFTLEVQHSDNGQYRQYAGMIPSKFDLKLGTSAIITGTFEFMGKAFQLLQATSMGSAAASQTFTPANATKGVFDVFENGLSLSATTYVKSIDLQVDNKLRVQEAVSVFGSAGIGAGTMENTGKLQLYFADATMYNKFISGAASSLSLPILDVNGNGYVYNFPRIKYTAAKVNTGGLDQDLMLDVDFQALPDIDPNSGTYQKSVVIYRVGSGVSAAAAGLDTRPRYGIGNATAGVASPAALLASMTAISAASNGSKAGTFANQTSAGNYGWVAVVASASTAGVTFTDSVGGTGGWSGASSAGNYTGSDTTPTTSAVTYTDTNGTVWRFFRQDYINANPSASNFTMS